jgi:hypothetical protein
MSNQPYVVPTWYVFTPEEKKENKQLEKKLMEAIIQDPEIGDATNVSVIVKKENGTRFVHLLGKLETEKERDRACELADTNTPIDFEVINEIVLY